VIAADGLRVLTFNSKCPNCLLCCQSVSCNTSLISMLSQSFAGCPVTVTWTPTVLLEQGCV